MVNNIDKFLHDLKISGTAEKTLKDYSRFLKNINKVKSLEKWDKTDVNRYIMDKQNECLIQTVEISKVKLKRFFTWAGKSELVSHLKINMPAYDLPAIPNTSMETARRPEMISTPFLNMGKFFPKLGSDARVL